MKRPLFAGLALLCFGAGWWMDAMLSDEAGPAARGQPAGVTQERNASKGKAPIESSPATISNDGIQSAADLLRLLVPGEETASRARLARALAGIDAPQLARLAADLKFADYEERMPAMDAVLEKWLAWDPARAAEFTLSLQDLVPTNTREPFLAAIETVFKTDLPEATRLMAKTEDRDIYIDARLRFIGTLKGQPPEEALAKIVTFDGKTRNDLHTADVLRDFPRQWVERDPCAALQWALDLPPGVTRRNILSEMAGAWGKTDSAAAREFLGAVSVSILPEGNLRRNIASGIDRAAPR